MRHRNDIDGLRAFAVLPILLFHAGVDSLGGGFVGVDIFFVISGYLITAIIIREVDAGAFSLLVFYQRRVARIAPALLATLALTLAAGCVLLLAQELRELARSAAAGAAFASNIFFWRTADYFGGAAEAKPLLHTWSLGVEEQFYILFPPLLVALRRRWPNRLRAVLLLITALSFLTSLALSRTAAPAAFYLLPSRAWELGVGALVAVGAVPAIRSERGHDLAAVSGLVLILAGVALIRPDMAFPAPSALLPCLGAGLLIAYGRDAATARLLGWRPLRLVGLISYSLYLWHWPIITFYRLRYGMALSPAETIGLVMASFCAAALSYRFVEQPFQRRLRASPPRPTVARGGAALAGAAALALAFVPMAAAIAERAPAVERVARYADYRSTSDYRLQFRRGTCFVGEGHVFDERACLAVDGAKRNVVLLGDSHAAQYSRALIERFPDVNVMEATASGCRPTTAYAGEGRCTSLVRKVLRDVVGRPGVTGVVLAGRWKRNDLRPLIDTVRYLRGKGLRVTVVGPTVEYDRGMPAILARAMIQRDPELVEGARLRDRAEIDAWLAGAVDAAGATYFSAWRAECPAGRCRLYDRMGGPFHFDYGHLTLDASREVVAAMPAI